MKSKEQLDLENIYSDINKETLNEQGIYPETTGIGTVIFYTLITAAIYALGKIDSSLQEGGKLKQLKDILLSDQDLKEKILNILSKKEKISQSEKHRKELGLPPVKARRI